MKKNCKNVLFIAPPNPYLANSRSVPRIGLLYLGAVLENAGYSVVIRHLHSLDELRGVSPGFDFIGITATTREYPDAIQILNYFKRIQYQATIAIGGAHATSMPEECLNNGFDLVVMGEADETIIDLVSGVNIPENRIFQCPPIRKLDHIPFPARNLLGTEEKWTPFLPGVDSNARTASMLLSRGCPYRCTFCGPHEKYTRRSNENVDQELELLNSQGYKNLIILDDLPFVAEKQVKGFCKKISKYSMRYRCNFRADLLNHNSAKMLKDSGCTRIQFGIESPSNQILSVIKKGASVDKNARAIKICREAGIQSKAMMIWGLPGDTAETAEEIVNWIDLHRPDSIQLSSFTPLPGSPLWKQGYDRSVTDYQTLSFFDDIANGSSRVINNFASIRELNELRHSILDRVKSFSLVDLGISEVAIPYIKSCKATA